MRRIPARVAAVVAIALAAIGVGTWALAGHDPQQLAPRAEAERPTLLLLTTLPLVFPEQFTLEGGQSEALKALETRYRVIPIGTTDAAALRQGRLLLMAHPLAQPAEALVQLDEWVRAGGRVLLLADPMLEWPSERPLGDKLRPPPAFSDTGLLQHWGLRLAAPASRGPAQRELSGRGVLAASPGVLAGSCDVDRSGFLAECEVDKGKVSVVADADFLNVEELGRSAEDNLDALLAELDTLER